MITLLGCHSDPSARQWPGLAIDGEESRSEYFQDNARFLVVPIRSGLLGMTGETGFSAACLPQNETAPVDQQRPQLAMGEILRVRGDLLAFGPPRPPYRRQ